MEESYLEKLDNNEYLCLLCNKRVPRKDNARRHIRLKHMQEEGSHWTCDVCHKGYKNKLVLDDHYRKIHGIYKTVQNWLEIKFNPQILLNLLFFSGSILRWRRNAQAGCIPMHGISGFWSMAMYCLWVGEREERSKTAHWS